MMPQFKDCLHTLSKEISNACNSGDFDWEQMLNEKYI